MIVYGVIADVSIAELFIAGIVPGILLALLISGYIALWSLRHPHLVPPRDAPRTLAHKLRESKNLIPVIVLIAAVLGSIYAGIATATEAAAVGVVGALAISALPGSLDWATFRDSLMGGARMYCMIALILAGASFLTLSMGYIGLPRHLAEWIATLGPTRFQLILMLAAFYAVLGCFLDGISMVVLTMGVILPTIQKAGVDPLWFGIFIVLVGEMAQFTPPVGFKLFVLQSMSGREITWIARVTLPFFGLMGAAILLVFSFPQIVTFLPAQMRRWAAQGGRRSHAPRRSSTISNADDKPASPASSRRPLPLRPCRKRRPMDGAAPNPHLRSFDMNDSFKTPLALAGRVLLALMFVLSGFGKLGDIAGTAGYIASGGLPMASALAVIVGLLELLGGLAIVVGFQARWAALALGLFTLAASLLFHKFWAAPADQAFVQQLLFMKNLSVAGGMFLVAALGTGPLSIDARRAGA